MTKMPPRPGQAANPPAPDDEELLARLKRRDAVAFELFLKRHFGTVHRLAARAMGDPQEAEDIAQEVFLKLWRKPDIWRPEKARFTTWAYRVTANAAIDRLRKRRHDPIETALDTQDDGPGPETTAIDVQRARRIAAALEELPPRQKIALVLTFYQGCSNKESAEIMGLKLDALESLLARGRRKLKTLLADDWRDLLSETG